MAGFSTTLRSQARENSRHLPDHSRSWVPARPLNRRTRMAAPEEINADMLAFWNGKGGDTWVARQQHTDITLTPVTDALLAFAAPRAGERVLDIGCVCGAPTLDFARAVGPSGRVVGLDISGPMLAEGDR